MEVYYEGQRGTPPAVDIVFVHGLKGDVNETWTTDGVCWPRDLLKEDVPKARIMSWAWDSSIAGAMKYSSQTTLFQNAETLLDDLQFSRASTEEAERPLIFIGHSLGGLLIKGALIRAAAVSSHHENPGQGAIYQHTIGVIFMATPHRGSDTVPFAKLLQTAAAWTWRQPNKDLLNVLERNSSDLFQQLRNFTTISEDMSLVCLYESEPTSLGMIVLQDSAVFDGFGIKATQMPGNHSQMCKFKSRSSIGYKRLLGHLRDILKKVPDTGDERPSKILRIASPGFTAQRPQARWDSPRIGAQIGQPSSNRLQIGISPGSSYHMGSTTAGSREASLADTDSTSEPLLTQSQNWRHLWNDTLKTSVECLGSEIPTGGFLRDSQVFEILLQKLSSDSDRDVRGNATALIGVLPTYIKVHDRFFKSTSYSNTGVVWVLLHKIVQSSISSPLYFQRVTQLLCDIAAPAKRVVRYEISASTDEVVTMFAMTFFLDLLQLLILLFNAASRKTAACREVNLQGLKPFEGATGSWEYSGEDLWNKDIVPTVDRILKYASKFIDTAADRATVSSHSAPQPHPPFANEESQREDGSMTCYCMSIDENPTFFDRPHILEAIRKTLNPSGIQRHQRILCLWGPGGVGKTQIALAYAFERKRAGIPIVLWVNSESELNVLQRLSEIAILLGLQGALEDGQHQRNKHLLKKFLETCGRQWLMVFDNVEDPQAVKDLFNLSGKGSILMTSRQEYVIVGSPVLTKEVTPFSTDEGARYLLTLLGKNTLPSKDSDVAHCKELCSDMGGLALALTIVGQFIANRRMPVGDYLSDWKSDPTGLYERIDQIKLEHYENPLSWAYARSFHALKEESARLFSILCFIGPDNIPTETFLGQDRKGRKQLAWLPCCKSSLVFGDVLAEMLALGLIKRNANDGQISVHRVIQLVFREALTRDQQIHAFDEASKVLFIAFPKFQNGLSLRNDWAECQKYAEHVTAMVTRFKHYRFKASELRNAKEFCLCIAACAWYLNESTCLPEALELLKTGFELCNDDKLLRANLLNTAATIAEKQSNTSDAEKMFLESLQIRQDVLPPDHEEVANSFNNLGKAYCTKQQYKEAINLFQKAIDIDEKKPPEESKKILYIRHLSMTTAYILLGDTQTAWSHLNLAKEYAMHKFSASSYYVAVRCREKEGLLYMKEGDYQRSQEAFKKALEASESNNPLNVQTGILHYRMAVIALKNGQLDLSIHHGRKALELADTNVPTLGGKGEVARAARILADALSRKQEVDNNIDHASSTSNKESQSLLLAANDIRREIQGDKYDQFPDTIETYDLLITSHYR